MNPLLRTRFPSLYRCHSISKQYLSSTSITQLSQEERPGLGPTSADVSFCESRKSPSVSSLIGFDEVRERQQSLMRLINKNSFVCNKPNLVLISGSSRSYLADTKIPSTHFKQNSDFIYLTGLTGQQSSDCVLALIGGKEEPLQSIFFAPFLNSNQQLWEGNDIR